MSRPPNPRSPNPREVAASAKLRRDVAAFAREMNASGVNQGTAGNISARRTDDGGIWVTPSGLDYEKMDARDIVGLDWSGEWRVERRGRKPSSEWRFHRDILAERPEFGAVLHAHPIHATALACHRLGLPPFHYMVALFGGRDVRCAPYATFGTEELSAYALAALEGRKACFLAHHGIIVCGADLEQALTLAIELETLAAQFVAASSVGPPPLLSDADIDATLEKIAAGDGYASAPPERRSTTKKTAPRTGGAKAK